MKFLHLSDIHFDPVNDGEDTLNLRNQFILYLKEKNIIVDELFLRVIFGMHVINKINRKRSLLKMRVTFCYPLHLV